MPLANSFHQLHFSSLPNGKKSWELIEFEGVGAQPLIKRKLVFFYWRLVGLRGLFSSFFINSTHFSISWERNVVGWLKKWRRKHRRKQPGPAATSQSTQTTNQSIKKIKLILFSLIDLVKLFGWWLAAAPFRQSKTNKFIHSLSSINKVELIEKRSEFICCFCWRWLLSRAPLKLIPLIL